MSNGNGVDLSDLGPSQTAAQPRRGQPLDLSDLGPPAATAQSGGGRTPDLSDLGPPTTTAQPGGGQTPDLSSLGPSAGAGAFSPAPMAEMRAPQQPTTWIGKFGQWAENVSNDIKYGTDITGIGTVLKKMGAHGVYAGNPEAVGDFMASLPLGLLKSAKGAAEVSPQIIGGPQGQTLKGVGDILGGGLQAATMPLAFAGPEAAEGIQAQRQLQGGVRSVLSDTAEETGVADVSGTTRMRHAAAELSTNVETKSKDLFRPIDEATNNEYTKLQKALRDNADKLRRVVDPDVEAKLEEQRAGYRVRLDEAIDAAKKAGVDPALADRAREAWKQMSALDDLDAQIKQSMPGHMQARGETINAQSFADRMQKMHDSGRLQEALGDRQADQLMEHAYSGHIGTEEEASEASQQAKRGRGVTGMVRRAIPPRRMVRQAAPLGTAVTIGGAQREEPQAGEEEEAGEGSAAISRLLEPGNIGPKATLKDAPPEIESAIQTAAQKYNLDPKLIRAVVQSESNFNPRAKGSKGEIGLMQLMPETRAALGMRDEDASDIEKNIDGGTRWLKQKIDAHGGDLRHGLTAYNGSGPKARQYAGNVLALYGGE